jgi:hypothetical protein
LLFEVRRELTLFFLEVLLKLVNLLDTLDTQLQSTTLTPTTVSSLMSVPRAESSRRPVVAGEHVVSRFKSIFDEQLKNIWIFFLFFSLAVSTSVR